MAEWYTCFLFPGTRDELSPEVVGDAFVAKGFELSSKAFGLSSDRDGLVRPTGEEVRLAVAGRGDPLPRLKELLSSESQLEIGFHGNSFYGSLSFAGRSSNPHITISWHAPRFHDISLEAQEQFFTLLCDVAERSGAAHVVMTIGPPDSFEESFRRTDSGRELRLDELSSEYLLEVWIIETNGGAKPIVTGVRSEQAEVRFRSVSGYG